jgi:exportin-T
MLEKFFQYMMPLFRNEYDDISREVLPFVTELLVAIRKEKRIVGYPNDSQKQMLPIILKAVLIKMKYSSETEWGNTEEESEEAEFQEFRKQLKTLQEALAVIDEPFFLNTLRTEIGSIFQQLKNPSPGKPQPEWRDLEFALHEMFLLGETGPKASGPTGGLFVKNKPLRPIAETLAHLMTEMMTTSTSTRVELVIVVRFEYPLLFLFAISFVFLLFSCFIYSNHCFSHYRHLQVYTSRNSTQICRNPRQICLLLRAVSRTYTPCSRRLHRRCPFLPRPSS